MSSSQGNNPHVHSYLFGSDFVSVDTLGNVLILSVPLIPSKEVSHSKCASASSSMLLNCLKQDSCHSGTSQGQHKGQSMQEKAVANLRTSGQARCTMDETLLISKLHYSLGQQEKKLDGVEEIVQTPILKGSLSHEGDTAVETLVANKTPIFLAAESSDDIGDTDLSGVDYLNHGDILDRGEEENQCALSNQMTESCTPKDSIVRSHKEVSGDFLIDGLSPGKMAKVREVLGSLDIKVWNVRGLGSRNKRRMVKDFLKTENPDVVMIQETKKEICDRRFVGSVWTARNKDWVLFRRLGLQEKLRKMGGSSLTPSMRDFDSFIRECELLDHLFGMLHSLGQYARVSRVFENMWLNHTKFKENFRDWWSGFQGNGWEGHKFMRRLQYVKAKLKEWNKFSFGELKEKKKSILNDLANFDAIEQEGGLNPDLRVLGVEGLDWSPISEESALRLDSPFTEEEISKAIFQLDRDKAPGPDGFTIAVFQECWDVIKEDLNIRFRPISLITSLYKIIAKVLSGRLRGVLHETIHYTQGAFVQGRQILDAVLIANEIVDERRRSGEEGVVFKIDFEKAYDHVKWDFLDHVLEKKGFSPRWRKWMSGCLSSVSYAILVNGSAKGWVKASRGLRQGDPLSPFLFTLVADVLSRMLMRAEERNMMEGFRTLKSLLLVFGHISGLKVNLNKSSIYGINLDQAHLSRLAEMLDCKASGWPILIWVSLWAGILRRVDFGIQWGWGRQKGSFSEVGCCVQTEDNRGFGFGEYFLEESRSSREMVMEMVTSLSLEGYCSSLSGFSLITRSRSSRPFLWNLNFRRNLSDSEIEDLEGLMRSTDDLYLSPSVPDARLWPLSSSGSSQSNPFFLALSQPSGSPQDFPSKFVWNSQVPFKVSPLSARGINRSSFSSLLLDDWVVAQRGIVLWQAASIALIRVVWWERNARIFEDKARNSGFLWDSIVFLASLWAFVPRHLRGFPLISCFTCQSTSEMLLTGKNEKVTLDVSTSGQDTLNSPISNGMHSPILKPDISAKARGSNPSSPIVEEVKTPLANLTNNSCSKDWHLSSGDKSASVKQERKFKRLRKYGDTGQRRNMKSMKENSIDPSGNLAETSSIIPIRNKHNRGKQKPVDNVRAFIEEKLSMYMPWVSSEAEVSDDEEDDQNNNSYDDSFIDDRIDPTATSTQAEDSRSDMMAIYRF
ncbi:Transposon TX1 uncharacterized 149 kDa protein [Vitis vinifera]|uniref:Transposon TX1 uncharacterized 149 kDa protein n=1 Tax=Vitis vinifera TaxID=29760 RepID=A0A438CCF1_VITVI|nr:Transposon TX1 uncharacterized 149 kDa protein [Vitis vinifera]